MKLKELMALCTKLSERVAGLEKELQNTRKLCNSGILKLSKRVTTLEDELKKKEKMIKLLSAQKDSPKQGRKDDK
jgi:hypothetical protein